MSKTMTWNYKGEADITLGEVHASPLPKILTALIVLAVIVVGIFGFIQRDFIYDQLNNPHIVLNKNSVVVQYQSQFDPMDFIDKTKTLKYANFIESTLDEELNNPYKLNIDSNVDTNHPGQYTVTYNSTNHIQSNEVVLSVTVPAPKDEIAPTITLKINEIQLYYNSEDIKSFDPMDYVRSYSDDKSLDLYLKSNLTYEISESGNSVQLSDIHNLYIDTSDLDQDGEKLSREEIEELISTYMDLVNNTNAISYSIEFTTKDEADNSTSVILNVIVTLDAEAIETELNELIAEFNEKQETPIVTNNKPSENNNQNNSQNSNQNSNSDDQSPNNDEYQNSISNAGEDWQW